jgi:hypothetical protein
MADERNRFTALADDGVEPERALDDDPSAADRLNPAAPFDDDSSAADRLGLDWCAESRRLLSLALPSMLIQANVFWLWLYNSAFGTRFAGPLAPRSRAPSLTLPSARPYDHPPDHCACPRGSGHAPRHD